MRILLALGLAAIAVLTGRPAAAQETVLHQERSLYRNLYVVEEGGERCLTFRARRYAGRQSCMMTAAPERLVLDYTQMMLAGLYLHPKPARILVIGLGGATLPKALQSLVPSARIDVVELDAAVDRTSRRFFGFKPAATTRVVVSDARVFVKRRPKGAPGYDMVFVDAFEEDYIPEHLLTREFLTEVRAAMAPGGVIVANTFSSSRLYDHESVTYRAVFGPFFNMRLGNRVIVGRLGGLPPVATVQANAAAWEPAFRRLGARSDFLLPMMSLKVDWSPKARLLTDQYSPANLLNN